MIRSLKIRSAIVAELFTFLWKEKIWWMIPLVIALLCLGMVLLFAQGSALAPFVYTIF